jgi:predicted AlkP superfamily phosphohydrolase/phosphomutase
MSANNSTPRVVVIGLDVGDGRLIREWARQGFLPTLNALLKEGTWGWLGTTAETLHVSAWPSLYTGALTGKHGVYYTFQPAPGQQGARRFAADQYGQPPFWQLLSMAGKDCVIFDAPYTHPQKNFGGIQVFEWGTWAHYWKPMSTPPQVLQQLTRQCGAYALEFEANQIGMGYHNPAEMQARLTQAVASKARAMRWLITQTPWDLFLVVFGETHAAAHYCWPIACPHTAGRNADDDDVFLRRVYEAVDQAIAEVLADIGEDVTVFIVSGDGVGPNYSGWHLLPEVLQRLGFTVTPGRVPATDVAPPRQEHRRADLLKTIRDLVPSDFRQTISRYLPTQWRDYFMLRWATAGIDWSRTRAFCLPTDLEGCIRINVAGREPAGIVRPGEEYTRVCQELTAALRQLINPTTGRPAVRDVIQTDDVLSGERRHYLPDLIVRWADEAAITAVHAAALGTVAAPSPDARTGTHCPPGFVIAQGPWVPRGQVLEGGHVVDFAPTILAQFGLSCPPHMDGRVWGTFLPE